MGSTKVPSARATPKNVTIGARSAPLGVGVTEGVRDAVGDRVAVRDGVAVPDCPVGLLVGVLGLFACVDVAVAAEVGVRVGEGVTVAVGVLASPIRTMMRAVGPGSPLPGGASGEVSSNTRTVRSVSPGGNSIARVTEAQNCSEESGATNRKSISGGTRVHASCVPRPRGAPLPSTNRQPKSLRMRITLSVGRKLGGCSPGTPPALGPVLSHTASLPSPRGRDAMIWRSGGPERSGTKVSAPTWLLLGPRAASTTMLKPKPCGREKMGIPSGVVPIGSIGTSSERVSPK